MNKHWLVIVLFISLAFNLAVMIMFAYVSIYHKPPFPHPGMKPRHERDFDRMHRPGMNMKMQEMMGGNKEELKPFRDSFDQKREAFIQSLSRDTLNVKEVEAAMEASLKAHEDLERHLGQSLIKMRSNMSGKEAGVFFKERLKQMRHNQEKFHQRRNRLNNNNKDNKEKGDIK